MARVEITDSESARAWLETQPHQVQIWFAARCALRVLPTLGRGGKKSYAQLSMLAFRAVLIAAAAATCKPDKIGELDEAIRGQAKSAQDALHSPASFCVIELLRSAWFAIHAITSSDPNHSAESYEASVLAAIYAEHTVRRSATDAPHTRVAASVDTTFPDTWPQLWPGKDIPRALAGLWTDMERRMQAAPEIWGFWLEWYRAILVGSPLPWDLSLEIAKGVTAADWDAGPEVVAARIAEIRARYELEQRISDLEQERDRYRAQASRLGIGGNNPPEPLEDARTLHREATVIWAAIDDLKAETAAPTPDKARIDQIVDILSHGLIAITRWLGGKGDLAIDTLIKWGMPVGAGTLLARPELLEAVIGAARQWLHLMP